MQELAENLLDGSGTPMDKVYSWLEERGYSFITFRPDKEQVKELLTAGIPLLMDLKYHHAGHVEVIHGFDDGLEGFFVRDPGNIFPGFRFYEDYEVNYANSDREALCLVPPDKDTIRPFLCWDEPDIRNLANSSKALREDTEERAQEILTELATRNQGQRFFHHAQLAYYPGLIGEASFREAVDYLWDSTENKVHFQLHVVDALIRRELYQEASERLSLFGTV